ncbi:NAD(P)H-hydrate dehydratase [Candidatus Ruminimicrobium bovinum]|uniref:NAD(P)H-hydrate dehydratase n=1 Tax=Candidatus Ruminimicrobium bovinum TaxID=3242779 RepID=UPI0039B8D398
MNFNKLFKRKKNSYKNNFGHVLVVASSYNMPGAGVLCSNAAIRSGAGLVTFAFPESIYPAVIQNIKPEIMLLPLKEKNKKLTEAAKTQVINFIDKRKITSVVIGCGCGQSLFLKNLIKSIIKNFEIYVVIDADGINSFSNQQQNSTVKDFINSKAKIIITPHPKEFERISGMKYDNTSAGRKKIAETFAKNNDIICVLKGHKTVVSDGEKVYINNTGNPGMATAGSGDVLSGIIASVICNENNDLLLKTATAVYIHGLAGDFAAKNKTQVSMTASDIIENLPKAFRSIK